MSLSTTNPNNTTSPFGGRPSTSGRPSRRRFGPRIAGLLARAAACVLVLLVALAPAAFAEGPDDGIDVQGEVLVAQDASVPVPGGDGSGGTGEIVVVAGTTPAVEESTFGNNYVLGDSVSPGLPGGYSCGANPWNQVAAHDPAGVDDGEITVTAPFNIHFYGNNYNDLTVGVNGGILMGGFAGDVAASNQTLATNAQPGIFPFWDNLEFDVLDANHSIYTCTQGFFPNRQFKVIWFNVDCAGCDASFGETATFEVVFNESTHRIDFNYVDTNFGLLAKNHGNSATIGIDSGIGGHLEYSVDEDSILSNPFTVQFWPATCNSQQPTLVGTRAGEVLYGTNGDDVIIGYAGNDEILGYDGNDLICGGAGNDAIKAGEGHDTVYGGTGNDRIRLGDGDDYAEGDLGDDIMRGGDGEDEMHGEDGHDTVVGQGDHDLLTGGEGDDTLRGRGGSDYVSGGAGDDMISGNSGADILDGGDDHDTLKGAGGADSLTGGSGNDILEGGNSQDTVNGEGGDDSVEGGANDDTLMGGGGTDACVGNGGYDTAISGCESFHSVEAVI